MEIMTFLNDWQVDNRFAHQVFWKIMENANWKTEKIWEDFEFLSLSSKRISVGV